MSHTLGSNTVDVLTQMYSPTVPNILRGSTGVGKKESGNVRGLVHTSSNMGGDTPLQKRKQTSDSSLKNSWAAYSPGNSNHLEIILTELKDPRPEI